ncbi:serine hydrolase domain-containing protein [Polaribacter sargassicola]|uniref:serine hydrolase domain-containing protein n=1 Tax=Polaribacter sargassicola TaxID=2836891 RepID=UPI001F21D73E|nr:serine hydrolase [Polaribacter sp. DS7-9]MCG1035753.1 beta-lactamase family protein [Polaribacter sp. DS7-9]
MKNKFLFFIISIIILSSCSSLRPIRYGAIPTQKSYKRFPSRAVKNSDTIFNFIKPSKEYGLGKKIGLINKDFNATNVSLDSFVKLHKTVSFMIIRKDTILYENYQRNYSDTTKVSSFSVVKPILSTLIGIAIDEGKIKSVEDYLVDYLPEFKNKVGFNKIKVRHLLHHTSGIAFSDNKFDLFSDNVEFYWGENLRDRILNVEIEYAPGKVFKYSSENTMLLALIIEKITNNSVSNYLQERIWKKLGMEAPAEWSLDRDDEKGIEKVFCCLQATTKDFAKFARLYLNDGNWKGEQIVSKEWVKKSTSPHPTGNNKHFYHNNWGIGPLKYGSFFAIGLYGQYLYVYPEEEIIIVRFGDKSTYLHTGYWNQIFLQIIDQL